MPDEESVAEISLCVCVFACMHAHVCVCGVLT